VHAPQDASHENGPPTESRRSRPWGPWLAQAAFESVMILVSILAAFAIDNWREDNERARRLTEARGSLMQELRFNLDLLSQEDYLPHHLRLGEIYRGMMLTGTTDRADALFERGIHPAPLRDAAWRSFLVSGVAGDLRFAVHARLAGIYGAQERLNFMHQASVASLIVSMYLADVVASEKGLQKEYQAAVKELEAASQR
jgi:hypothetical protein